MNQTLASPRKSLSVFDTVAIIVGIVIGAGIFGLPPLVAMNLKGGVDVGLGVWPLVIDGNAAYLLVWIFGGLIAFIGAMCYAELSTAYPDTGGEYHFLHRAYGSPLGFLYGWARMTVIQTGSIAAVAFVVGHYCTQLLPAYLRQGAFGDYFPAVVALGVVVLLTALNLAGLVLGKWVQNLLALGILAGLTTVIVSGFSASGAGQTAAPTTAPAIGGLGALGMAMIFVMFTYGGWNEAAYVSAEVRQRRGILWALVLGIGIVTVIYVLVAIAMVRSLGVSGVSGNWAVGADLLRSTMGDRAAMVISLIVILAGLGTANATIITGARTNYSLGRDFALFRWLGEWRQHTNVPARGLLLQGAIAAALVLSGVGLQVLHGYYQGRKLDPGSAWGRLISESGSARGGLEMMVAYTAPVFWLFFGLVGLSVIVLRLRDDGTERPFRVPLYPATPILFCIVCGYMCYSAIAYAGPGAWLGMIVVLAGVPLVLLSLLTPTVGPPGGFPLDHGGSPNQ